MNKLVLATSFAALCSSANAAVFDFSWEATFAPFETLDLGCDGPCDIDERDTIIDVLRADPEVFASASGTIEIDAGAGETFTVSDIVASSITVSGVNFSPFVMTTWTEAGGTISADGLSASFSAEGNPYMADGEPFFGCSNVGCSSGVIEIEASGFYFEFYDFGDGATALASMVMTRQDTPPPSGVPLPAGAPLLLAGLAALGWTRRKG